MDWLNSWSESVTSLSNDKISNPPLKLPLRGVSSHGHFVVVAEAEVFFGLRADEAGARSGDEFVLIELEGELAFFAEGGGDAMRLVVGGVVGLGGGEGFTVAGGPDELAVAGVEGEGDDRALVQVRRGEVRRVLQTSDGPAVDPTARSDPDRHRGMTFRRS